MTQEQFHNIGETEISSHVTSCADSTAIYDWYEKIVGLIIPPKVLKKGSHVSHVYQQVTVWRERYRMKVDPEE